MKKGRCPFCGKERKLQKHHWIPKMAFGPNPFVVLICYDCHKVADGFIKGERDPIECAYHIFYFWKYGETYKRLKEARDEIKEWNPPITNK